MADNIAVTPGSGATVAADEIGGVLFQRVKLAFGADGQATDLSQANPAPVSQVSSSHDVSATITRPANVTAYTASDVVGSAAQISAVGLSGGAIIITGAQLEIDVATIPSGMTSFKLYLYSVTPPSALADNSPFDLASGDRASFLGFIDLGTPVDLGSTLYSEVNALGKQVRLASANLFAYLVTVGAFTPGANSEVYKVTLHTVEV